MITIEYATEQDRCDYLLIDRHISESELTLKIRDNRCYIIREDDRPVGVMRYGLFWDIFPFLNLIYFQESCRGKGFGRMAMAHWEDEMRSLGHKIVMTSTMVEEGAQHFYRKLGYKDCGCLIKEVPPLVETMEMFLIKQL